MYDVIIIGSGPAGYTAAIYTSRSFLKTLVISGPQPGGQLTTTTAVDNFPGFPSGIQGPELINVMQKQAERFGTEIITDIISNLQIYKSDKSTNNGEKNTFIVLGQNDKYEAKSVIIATGASAKTLGLPSEEKYRGKGISYCATCDGFFFKNKNIAVLGGGDTAMEEATFLTRFAGHVTIIHRRNEFRATPIMLEKAKADKKISFLLDKTIKVFTGDTTLQGVVIIDNKTGKQEDMPFDGVFVAIGNTPATAFLKDFILLDETGYVVLKKPQSHLDPQTRTSVEGVFAAGDCVDMRYRQAVVASGMGCMAAMDVEKYLET